MDNEIKEKIKKLYNLEPFDCVEIYHFTYFRVPNGWICGMGGGEQSDPCITFIPFSTEFEKHIKGDNNG